MDIAQLGVAVESSQVDKGTVALNRFTGAAGAAERASRGLASADQQASGAAAQVATSANAAAAALDRQAGSARRAAQASSAANDNVKRMGGSFSGLAAQFQDIGVTAAMGMSPAIIALQQGTQIAGQMEAALQAGGSAAGVLGQAFASLLSPLSLTIIALTALAALGIQLVDWTKLAQGTLRALAGAIEPIAPYAIAAAAALALFYSPAIIAGIVQVIALLARLAVQAVATGAAMLAANPAGAIVLGVAAAVVALNAFREEIAQIFGRDIVADAKAGVNFIVGSFVGAFTGIRSTWSQLPGVLGDVAYTAAQNVIETMQNLVNTAIFGINKVIEYANRIPGVDLSSIGQVDFGSIQNPYEGQAEAAADSISRAIQDARGTDYVGQFMGAVSRGASDASKMLTDLAGSLDTVDKKAAKAAERAKKDYAEIVQGANQFIAGQVRARESIGLTEQAAARLRYEQELMNKAANDNIKLTPQQTAELKALAASMAEAEAQTTTLKRAFDFAKDLTKGFVSDLRNGLQQGEGFWRSFGNAALNVLDKITDKLLNQVVDALFQVGSAAGGGGGFFGSLLGGIGSLFGFKNGGVFSRGNVIPFASGGVVTQPTMFPMRGGRAGVMGEAGPEAIMPLRRGAGGRLGVDAGGGGSPGPLVVDIGVSVDNDGNLQAFVRRTSVESAAVVVRESNKSTSARVAQDQRRFG